MIIMSKKTIRAQAAAEEMNYRLSAFNPLFTELQIYHKKATFMPIQLFA